MTETAMSGRLDYLEQLLIKPPPPPPKPRPRESLKLFFTEADRGRRLAECQGGVHIDGPPPSVTNGASKALEPAWTARL